jgi:AcrR family transcriptional regulator
MGRPALMQQRQLSLATAGSRRVGRPRIDPRPISRPPEEEVLARAAELFARQGFARSSTREIAKAAGLRQASLFHYFATKEDILVALTEQAHVKPLATLALLLRQKRRPSTTMFLIVRAHVLHICENHIALKAILESSVYINVTRFRRYLTQEAAYARQVKTVIQAGIDAGEFAAIEADLATSQVLGMCNWVIKWYRRGGKKNPDEIAEHFARAAIRSLGGDMDAAAADLV